MSGPLWVEDNSIGSALSQIVGNNDPAATYLKALQARQLRDQIGAGDNFVATQGKMWPEQAPSVALPPDQQGPPSPATPQEQTTYTNKRDAALAAIQLAARNVPQMGVIAKATPELWANTDLLLNGIPNNQADVLKQQVQLTGQYPSTIFDSRFTEANMTERYAGILSKAQRGIPLSPDDKAFAQFYYEKQNPTKVKIEGGSALEGRERLPSQQEQAAGLSAPAPPQVGTPAPVTPPPQQGAPPIDATASLQPTPISGTGAAQTVATPPQQAPVVPPATAPTGQPATAPQTRVLTTPGGGQISVTPLPGGTTPAGQATATAALVRAQNARGALESTIGVDPKTGLVPPKYYVPPLGAAAIQENSSGGLAAQAGSKLIENLWQKRAEGQPDVQSYYTAARQWIEPVLRLASGAAINPSEYTSYFAQFIPNALDSPKQVQDKINAMRSWEYAIATAQSPAAALAIMEKTAGTNPVAMQAVETMRVLGTQQGTLNTPYTQLQAGGGSPQQPQQAAAAAAPPQQAAPPAYDKAKLDAILGLRR